MTSLWPLQFAESHDGIILSTWGKTKYQCRCRSGGKGVSGWLPGAGQELPVYCAIVRDIVILVPPIPSQGFLSPPRCMSSDIVAEKG